MRTSKAAQWRLRYQVLEQALQEAGVSSDLQMKEVEECGPGYHPKQGPFLTRKLKVRLVSGGSKHGLACLLLPGERK